MLIPGRERISLLLTHCPILLSTYMHAAAGLSYVQAPTALYITLLSATCILLSLAHCSGPEDRQSSYKHRYLYLNRPILPY